MIFPWLEKLLSFFQVFKVFQVLWEPWPIHRRNSACFWVHHQVLIFAFSLSRNAAFLLAFFSWLFIMWLLTCGPQGLPILLQIILTKLPCLLLCVLSVSYFRSIEHGLVLLLMRLELQFQFEQKCNKMKEKSKYGTISKEEFLFIDFLMKTLKTTVTKCADNLRLLNSAPEYNWPVHTMNYDVTTSFWHYDVTMQFNLCKFWISENRPVDHTGDLQTPMNYVHDLWNYYAYAASAKYCHSLQKFCQSQFYSHYMRPTHEPCDLYHVIVKLRPS